MSATLLSAATRQQARQALLARLDQVQAACGMRFPLFATSADGPWQSSAGGSWMGGFWAASWHLRVKLQASQGSGPDSAWAHALSAALETQTGVDSINRSMIFWYGAALPACWGQAAPLQPMLDAACQALAASFDRQLGAFALGCDQGGGVAGKQRIGVDSLAACISLLCNSAEPAHHALARQHADTLLRVCGGIDLAEAGRPPGAWHAEARFEDGRWVTHGQPGDWSRGQAWAMLGLSRAAAQWGEPYLPAALQACDYWQQSRPLFPAPDRLHGDQALPDPSANLIAALARLALAALVPAAQAQALRQQAEQDIAALLHSAWFNGLSNPGADPAHPGGIFSGCCYTTRPGQRQLVESPWGSFLLLAALAILDGDLSPQQC